MRLRITIRSGITTQLNTTGSTRRRRPATIAGNMGIESDAPQDLLWKEYGLIFRDFDDLTLARWMAQTLGQFEGKSWRYSHPLMGAYRLAAQIGHERQIWLQRLATPPPAYAEAPCCRAPLLPLLTRDVREAGLICPHCNETLVAFEELPGVLKSDLEAWAERYGPIHAVAHWEEPERKQSGDYDRAFERAAEQAEELLAEAGRRLAPRLLEFYPAAVWEDQDECLEVRPEDVGL